MSYLDLLADLQAETAGIARQEPEGYRKLRTGTLENRPGSEGAYFGALDIAHGMLRDFAMYTVYPTLALHREQHDVGVSRAVVRQMFPTVLNYLGYSGFPEMKRLGHQLLEVSGHCDWAQFEQLLVAFLRYVNTLYAWCYHWFPWNLGDAMRYPDGDAHKAPLAGGDIVDTLVPTDTLIRLRWAPLGIEVRAFLCVDRNPELCQELLDALPFTCLQSHPMVSGESIFAWTPLTSTAPTPFKEEIRTAPIGRLRFSQRTGQKLTLQYGVTSEDILSPVLGSVLPEDRHLLRAVGTAVWASTYESKVEIWLTVERCPA
ncbi:hypothetical protein [Hydrogenophaga sp. BPS33]|uniref:cucumopine synthase-related protein n=1 Tax=Hydrogenophaga sp. BPS33 TaxID=2651974 RepID=UPI0013202281|nr:hypothetical protein [Hydrogenophaga sp. BPS33]QHE84924.1 hypothetical protein F9K07_08505 [Hydrogenophaga sp. BPS33]